MKTRIISLQFAYFLRDVVERPDLEAQKQELQEESISAFPLKNLICS